MDTSPIIKVAAFIKPLQSHYLLTSNPLSKVTSKQSAGTQVGSVKKLVTISKSKKPNKQKVILILADGVRYDYIKDPNLKGIQRMARNGVKAEYVQPIFPSNSYPNWYTIVTGLYAESHGMIQNFMYDPVENDTFLMSPHPNASHPHWWSMADPLWTTAEKQGVKTAVFWWDGCQVEIRNTTPSMCLEYQSYWTWPTVQNDTLDACDEILDNFEKDDWGLALVYFEAVDANGHAWGSESSARIEAMKDLDQVITRLQDGIESRKMTDLVNIVLVSDHGMVTVIEENGEQNAKVIEIETIVDPNDIVVMFDRGTTSMLLPVKGKEQKVLDDLKKASPAGLRFYAKSDIPIKYHFKNNRRVSPILLVAEKGYFVRGFTDYGKTKPLPDIVYSGHHGYDPYAVKEMRTIMLATGPGLRKGYTSPPLMMTDHYNLVCHLLDINAQPNNGSWLRIEGMLAEESSQRHSSLWPTSQANHVSQSNYLSALTLITLFLILCRHL
uniref:glycerophosphocholine cholinephosphodiesterase n=1 Tax=Tetranychus urticae TaxID=32264 RepID=T1K1S1_TETUR